MHVLRSSTRPLGSEWSTGVSAKCGNCCRETDLFLCRSCEIELHNHLESLPWFIRQLEVTVTRQDRLATGSVGRSGANPSPINIGAMELSRTISTTLIAIVRDLTEERGRKMPILVTDSVSAAIWLGAHVTAISSGEGAGETMNEIRGIAYAIGKAINRSAPMYCGPCTTIVGRDANGEVECGRDLWADREEPEQQIQCRKCLVWITPREQLLTMISRRDLLPEFELIKALTHIGEAVSGEDCFCGSFDDDICRPCRDRFRDWLYRGKLRIRGYLHDGIVVRRKVQDGDRRLFSLAQVRQLMTVKEGKQDERV